MAALVYIVLLGLVLVFFASVGRMNKRWERAFHENHPYADIDDELSHVA